MSDYLNSLLEQANAIAEVSADMNEAQKGGGGQRLLPVGYAFGRLVEVIEIGKQPQEYNGKPKDPEHEVQLGFALWGEGYQNEDGTPYIMRPFPFKMSRNEKAATFLLFKALNWKGTAKHFAQLLNGTWLLPIEHYTPKSQPGVVKSRINLKGILPPLDPVTKAPYPIPEATPDLFRLFLWERPTVAAWDALYVDGTWEDGGSKNKLQETMIGAVDFQGSALENLLKTSGKAIPVVAAKPAAPAAPAAPSAAVPPAAPVAPAAPTIAPAAPAVAPAAPLVSPASPAAVASPATPAAAAAPVVTSPASATVAAPALPGLPSLPSLPALPVAA